MPVWVGWCACRVLASACKAGARRWRRRFPLAALIAFALAAPWSAPARCETDWITGEGTPEARVQLYFFWSSSCPHCGNARPFVEELDEELEWLELHAYELTAGGANIARYIDMAAELGQEARSVPAFFVCGQMLTGYDHPNGIGALIRPRIAPAGPVAGAHQAGLRCDACCTMNSYPEYRDAFSCR